jgi:DNA-binding CsgD family transcriptional regulator/tetratricopeptide (TPR) repeat protein
MKWFLPFLWLLLLFLHFKGKGQSADVSADFPMLQQEHADTFISKYLSDTLHAAQKIRALVKQAVHEQGNPAGTVLKYQLALSLVPYASDSVEVLARLYAEFSSWLFNAGAFQQATHYGKSALAMTNRFSNSYHANILIYHLKARLGGYYLDQQEADSARKYYRLALEEAKKLYNPIWAASATNNLGYMYSQLGERDTALQFFYAAEGILPLTSKADSDLLGSIHDNIAEYFFQRKEIDKAVTLYTSNYELYTTLGNYPKILQAKTGLLKCNLAVNNLQKAYQILEELQRLSEGSTQLQEPQFWLKVLEAHTLWYMAISDWKNAFLFQEKIRILKDSLDELDNRAMDNIVRASTESEVAKANKEIQLQKTAVLRTEEKAYQNLLISIMVTLLAIAIIGLLGLYFRNSKRIMKYEQEITQRELENKKLEQEKLEQELRHKKGDLQGLGIYLSEIKDLHDSIASRLKEVKSTDARLQKEALKEILKELETKTNLEEKAALIQQNIEKVNTEFYNNLIRQFPNLTKSEVDLCGLLKLNLSNKEIGALKNISPDSVKMARNRLRKKIGMHPEEDIYAFMSKI